MHNPDIQRSFFLGDEWLYYKIYCGVKIADQLLANDLKPLTEELISIQAINNWFFIRYEENGVHLRVRFQLSSPDALLIVSQKMNEILKPYIEEDLVWKVQNDTYQREVERYGSNTMVLSEQIFCHDSNLIVNMLDLIEGDEGEVFRWHFALRAVDAVSEDFDYSIDDKIRLYTRLKEGYGKSFGYDNAKFALVNDKYRKEKATIENIINKSSDEKKEIKPLLDLLEQKSYLVQPIAKQIIALAKENQLEMPLDELLSSYIHMLNNRLFRSKQNAHELVIYAMLQKYWQSINARSGKNIK